MDERLKQLHNKITAAEAGDLEVLTAAVKNTREKYQSKPTDRNKKNWDAAAFGLEAAVTRLWEKYFNTRPAFKNVNSVIEWLKDNGYKRSRSMVYSDKDEGKLVVQADGTVLAADVRAYAATLPREKERSAGGPAMMPR